MFITDAAGLREAAKEYPGFNQAMLGERGTASKMTGKTCGEGARMESTGLPCAWRHRQREKTCRTVPTR